MKRCAILLLLIAMVAVLSNCSSKSDSSESVNARKIVNFKEVYHGIDVGLSQRSRIYVDTTTGVLYLMNWGDCMSWCTPLYNADGTLKRLNDWEEVQKAP